MIDWATWLRERETFYSGGLTRVERRAVSPRDGRLRRHRAVDAIPGKMVSGGRFPPESGYAEVYASRLCHRASESFVLVELGILLGVGLAVWCDVFPNASIIGLDVDPQRFDRAGLKHRGAFRSNSPKVHFLDELGRCARIRMERIMGDRRIDVLIDDALHDDASIMKAMAVMLPFMADRFTYFIEDNSTVHALIRKQYPDMAVESHGRLTVVSHG